ncbi:MAG: sulfotransferase family protein [Salinivenus sp.]
MSQTTLLILGAPRSGTTLLTAMIGRHDDVAMLNEDFGDAVSKLLSKPIVGNKLCIPNQIELDRKKPAWARLFGPFLHDRLYRYGYFKRHPEAARSINEYLEANTPIKVIGILRDGNAVVSSVMRRGEQSFDTAAYRWCRAIEILDTLSQRLGSDLLLLTFEELVQGPEDTMRRVAHFLEIPFQQQMLDGYAHTPIYSNKGIDPDRASRHKNNGTDHDLSNRFPDAMAQYEKLVQKASVTAA